MFYFWNQVAWTDVKTRRKNDQTRFLGIDYIEFYFAFHKILFRNKTKHN